MVPTTKTDEAARNRTVSMNAPWPMAGELVSFRYIVDGRTCLDWYVLNVGDERKRTRLSGRSAASWERTAEKLLSRWAALLIAARQHNRLGDL